MDNKKNDAVNLHIQMPKLLLKRFYNEYGKCNLFLSIPHTRQNTNLLVKWYYQIQGGHFYV